MQASILDLRYKMKDVLKALNRNEKVEILYHGKLKGIISPCIKETKQKVSSHPFFAIEKEVDVKSKVDELRGGRYNDL